MPRTRKLPGAIVTAAVLLFIYGGFMLGCSFCGFANEAVNLAGANDNPVDQAIAKEAPAFHAVQLGTVIFDLVLGATMILSGFGVLRLNPAGRWVGSAFAATDMFLAIISTAYMYLVVTPIQERAMAVEVKNLPPMGFDLGKLATALSSANICFSLLFSWGLCIPILLALNTKSAREAFAGKPPPPDGDERLDDDDGGNYDRPPRPPKSPGHTGFTARPD